MKTSPAEKFLTIIMASCITVILVAIGILSFNGAGLRAKLPPADVALMQATINFVIGVWLVLAVIFVGWVISRIGKGKL